MPSYIPGGIKLDYDELIVNHNGSEFSLAEEHIALKADNAKNFVRPENFIVVPENILVDATNAVQHACDYVSTNGGTVLLDKIYFIKELVLKSNTSIQGLNKMYSGFKSITNNPTTKEGLITQYDVDSEHIQLDNFSVDGGLTFGSGGAISGGANISGIYLRGDVAGKDLHHTLSNLEIKYCKEYGIYLNGTKETKMYNCNITQALKDGFHFNCTDSRFTNCTTHHVGRNGFWVESNNMLTGCKAFATGTMMNMEDNLYGDGFVLAGTATSLSSCEVQEAGRHGFVLSSTCIANELNGCIIDSVSIGETNGLGKGLLLDSAKKCKINVSICNRHALAGNMKQAIQINTNSYDNTIDAKLYTDDATNAAITWINSDYPVGNNITINGECISQSDFRDYASLNKFELSNIPVGFNEEIVGGITCSKSIVDKKFKVVIESATTWGRYKLTRYGKCGSGDVIDVLGKGCIVAGALFLRLEVAFYNASLTQLSFYNSPELTPHEASIQETYYTLTAPVNAVYYSASLVLVQNKATGTGSAIFTYLDARNTTNKYNDIYSATYDPPSIAANGVVSTTITIPGARVGRQKVDVIFSNTLSGVKIWGDVTVDNTVTVYFYNPTASPVDLASGTIKAKLVYI